MLATKFKISQPGPAPPTDPNAGSESKADDSLAPPPQQADLVGLKTDVNTSFFDPPKVSLPPSGGAIRSLGEKFSVNAVNGTSSVTIPVTTTAGRGGFGPSISISYSSGGGNGIFGLGWQADVPAITRSLDKKLPQYIDDGEDADVFVLAGSEDLVPTQVYQGSQWVDDVHSRALNGANYTIRRYRPRLEGPYARIERWTRSDGDTHWRTISRDNVTTLFGQDSNSRIADPSDPRKVFSWLVCTSYDPRGNAIVFGYKAEDSSGIMQGQAACEMHRTAQGRTANRYLKSVKYGNSVSRLVNPNLASASMSWYFEVIFDYGEHNLQAPTTAEDTIWSLRPDPWSTYRPGFEVRTYRLCRRVLMFHHFPNEPNVGQDCLVSSQDFVYDNTAVDGHSFLSSVSVSGYLRSGSAYTSKSVPPVEFTYSVPSISNEVKDVVTDNDPVGLSANYQLADLDGEGLAGILTSSGGSWYYKPNQGGGQFADVYSLPSPSSGKQTFIDLDRDGRMEFVDIEFPFHGYAARTYQPGEDTKQDGWGPITAFRTLPNISMGDPNLAMMDVNGDGLTDIIITEGDVITYYQSLGTIGYAAPLQVHVPLNEDLGPRCVFSDPLKTVHVADMSGDGLLDIVRVQNGAVSYWPNLGYGKFGPRVSMDGLTDFDTQDEFRSDRVVLADVNGSGASDIVYISADGAVKVFFNLSGNGFSKPQVLAAFPQVNSSTNIKVVDLLGTGTACLVWSSPLPVDARRPLKYVELFEMKPNLLTSMINNRGLETKLTYAPSTKFYLQDKAQGKPWITRLPFPVQVVEYMESFDYISQRRAVTQYAYHHGYFDGLEREFRGFAMVECWDTEEFSSLGGTWPAAANDLASSNSPPVLTRTWYHNGVYLDNMTLQSLFRRDYFQEPGLTTAQLSSLASLPESTVGNEVVINDQSLARVLTTAELREAYRALRGCVLRTEAYALDGSSLQQYPYFTSEKSFYVRLLQPRGAGEFQYAVFQTLSQESLDLHYERQVYTDAGGHAYMDPRTMHGLTLKTDQYGNILQSASVAYGRRHVDSDSRLTAADHAKQSQMYVTYSSSFVTNAILDQEDDYVLPTPYESMGYEVLKLQASSTNLVSIATLQTAITQLDSQQDLPPDDWSGSQATQNKPYRRMLSHSRSLFRSNDLSKVLPLGVIESLNIPYESYSLVTTDSSLQQTFVSSGKMLAQDLAATLSNEGHFVHGSDGSDPNWWKRSGRVFYTQDPNATPQQELAEAMSSFFSARRYQTPFHSTLTPDEAFVDPDLYILTTQETRDQLGNRMTVGARDTDPSMPLLQRGFDYVMMQPFLIMDANRNRSMAAFDEIGNVVATAVMGKPEEQVGDSLTGFTRISDAVALAFLQNPQVQSRPSLLQNATTITLTDIWAYSRTKTSANPQPIVKCGLTREVHVSDGSSSRIQCKLSYMDGTGRIIQRKVESEPDSSGPQWNCTGWSVYNNKGYVVQTYEPFYTGTAAFQFDFRVGVSSTNFYDPTGRTVGVLSPDRSWTKTRFDPWKTQNWDANHTSLMDPKTDEDLGGYFTRLLDTEYLPTWYQQRANGGQGPLKQTAAQQSALFSGLESIAYRDCVGQTFMTLNDNKWQRTNETQPTLQTIIERKDNDIQGRVHEMVDSLGRNVVQYDYTLGGSLIHSSTMDAGELWTLSDIAGKQLYSWNSRGYRVQMTYDAQRRPVTSLLKFQSNPEITIAKVTYGESLPNPELLNIRGQSYEVEDQGGKTVNLQFDFKANMLKSQKQIPTKYDDVFDVSGMALDPEVYVTETTYDALNRVTSATYYQDGAAPQKSSSLASYNTAGLLQTITAQLPLNAETQIVKNIQYTAKGQRSQIDYGNGTSTKYTYDQLTQRTVSLITTRPDSSKVQSLQYTYDAVGRITNITDAAQQTVYFDNTAVDPSSSYVYDAAGRLVQATGREHLGQIGATAPGPWDPDAAANGQDARNGSAMARYAESYFYDQVNNIQSIKHGGSNATTPGWTRTYNYAEPSLLQPSMVNNRLSSTTVGSTTSQYKYDGAAGVSGCMTSMPHLSVMTWGYNDMLQATASQVVNTGTPEMTYYQYNATNSRTRKVTNRQAAAGAIPIRKSERIYLGPLEIYREFAANGTDISLERQTMSFSDNSSRILLAETRTIGTSTVDPAPQQLLRYQLTNHLDSCCIELDATSALLSYEEYTPFGSSSYRATATALETPNRYRFAGRERDDETGFYDYGARAYAPWLGRWISADPLGAGADGVNVFAFVRNNPIMLSDQNGMQSTGGGPTVQVTPSPIDVTVWHLFMEGNFRTGGMQRVPIPSTADPGAYDFYGPKLTVTFDFLPGSRGKYGSELHENIDRFILPEAKDLNLPGADRMYSELAIGKFDDILKKIAGKPIRGSNNPDMGLAEPGQTLVSAEQNPAAATELPPGSLTQTFDWKSGGGEITPNQAKYGRLPGQTVNYDWARNNPNIPNAADTLPPLPPSDPKAIQSTEEAFANFDNYEVPYPKPNIPAPKLTLDPALTPSSGAASGTGEGPGVGGGSKLSLGGVAGTGLNVYFALGAAGEAYSQYKAGDTAGAADTVEYFAITTAALIIFPELLPLGLLIGFILTANSPSKLDPETEAWWQQKEDDAAGDVASDAYGFIHLGHILYRMGAEPAQGIKKGWKALNQ